MPHPRPRWLSDPLPEIDPWESSFPSSPITPDQLPSLASKPPSPSHHHHQQSNNSPPSLNAGSSGCLGVKLRFFPLSLMAHGQHNALPAWRDTKNQKKTKQKNENGQQRRQELEKEVAMLQKMLESEEHVHQVLERALLPAGTTGSTLHIPSFLPKKVKELLAELVIVEAEISRLEGEKSKLREGLCATREGLTDQTLTCTRNKQPSLIFNEHIDWPPEQPSISPEGKGMQEKVALETKPMFFINQAMKGDYTLHGFTNKERSGRLVENTSKDRKEIERMVELQDSVPQKNRILEPPRRSGILENPFSPKMPPRHPSPKQTKFNVESSTNFLEGPSIASSLDKSYKLLQPNQLSEKIMKCLICIFLRLIRTTRAMELEKSGNLLRSNNILLRSGSFRVNNNLNLKASFSTQKEMGQQDPYGIFDIEDSSIRDIGPYKNLIKFTASSLDLKGISSSLPLLNKLRILINSLREVDLRFMTHQQKLAFWINMHNTCIMHGFLEHGVLSSPQKMNALRNKVVLNIGGNKLNAFAIEHFILKEPSKMKEALWKGDKDDKEDTVRSLYGLEHSEPNILFVLCYGNRSSPAVKIYTADSVSAELEKSKVEYLQASIVVTASKRLKIPKLLLMNTHDFAQDLVSLVDWICNQLPTSGSLRKTIYECLKGHNSEKISDIVDVMPYDFEFQYLLPM